MERERLKAILESLLFAAGEPVTVAKLAAVLEEVAPSDIRNALSEMACAYAAEGRGIVLEQVAGGFQLRTAKENAQYVRKLLAAKPPRLGRPMMETLAIVAYRQPITRPEIEQLRGVDCGAVLDTLLERRFIRIAGRKDAPGRPIIYATTPEFLETFGLKGLNDLPDLGELREIDESVAAGGEAQVSVSAETPDAEPLTASEANTGAVPHRAPEAEEKVSE